MPLPRDKRVPPVGADIVEGADDVVPAAHAKQRLIRDLEGEEIPGAAKLAHMPCELPGPEEDRLRSRSNRVGSV